MKKNAIIFATYDGLSTMFSGVGKVSESYISNFSKFIERYNATEPDNSFDFIATDIFYDSQVHNTERFAKFRMENNFHYIVLPTSAPGTLINKTWGESVWQSASLALATFIGTISTNYNRVIVYCNDTLFMYVRKYLERFSPLTDRISIYWIPHSLGAFFRDRYTDEQRIISEKNSLAKFVAHTDRIIALNQYAEDVLIKDYEVPKTLIDRVYNGIKYEQLTGYPVMDKTIFLFGRCTPQKGFDLALPVILKFIDSHPYQVTVLAPTETSNLDYITQIETIVTAFPKDKIRLITKFADNEPIRILSALRNSIVIFASQYETAPLAPLEAILYTHPSVSILYSDIEPHKEIFDGVVNCYSFPKADPLALFKLLVTQEGYNNNEPRILHERYNFSEALNSHLSNAINCK